MRQNLDAIESGIDAAIDGVKQVVHDFREQAQEVMVAILDRMYQSWKEQRPRIDAYMDAHPWVVFGGVVFLAYLFRESTKRSAGVPSLKAGSYLSGRPTAERGP